MHRPAKHIIAASIALVLALSLWLTQQLPASQPSCLPPPRPAKSILLLPLDSRPVCSTMVQKLGALADLNVILPPKAYLDNYQTPADRQKLLQWLQLCAPYYSYSIISADNLLHGGLLAARQGIATPQEEDTLLSALKQQQNASKQQAIFSVIPRLLVSDQLLPDRWYKYQLLRYSELADMVRISGSYNLTRKLRKLQAKIPPKVLAKYLSSYQQSNRFNLALLQQADAGKFIVFGQDDASPIGLPHASAELLLSAINSHGQQAKAQLSYGADEIAALLLARYYLQELHWQPKVYLKYANPAIEQQNMPYMAVSTGTALRSQLQLLGASEAQNLQEADLVCYINCGSDKFAPGPQQAQEVSTLLEKGCRVAIIDSSANFETTELLLPQLLANNVPINKLTAYAAWNTFSNASGTALAQGLIFCGHLQQLQKSSASTSETAALYAANLNFTVERILEDYCYQKLLHPKLRQKLLALGTDPTQLTAAEKTAIEQELQPQLSLAAYNLLHHHLGRTPFFSQGDKAYYLRDLAVGAQLPWDRIFEISLQVWTQTGEVKT